MGKKENKEIKKIMVKSTAKKDDNKKKDFKSDIKIDSKEESKKVDNNVEPKIPTSDKEDVVEATSTDGTISLSKFADIVGEKVEEKPKEKDSKKVTVDKEEKEESISEDYSNRLVEIIKQLKDIKSWKDDLTIDKKKEMVKSYLTIHVPTNTKTELLDKSLNSLKDEQFNVSINKEGIWEDDFRYNILKSTLINLVIEDLGKVKLEDVEKIVNPIPKKKLIGSFESLRIKENFVNALLLLKINMYQLREKYREVKSISAVKFLKSKLGMDEVRKYEDYMNNSGIGQSLFGGDVFDPTKCITTVISTLPESMEVYDNCPLLSNPISLLTMKGMTNNYFMRLIKIQLIKSISIPITKEVKQWLIDNKLDNIVEDKVMEKVV